MTTSMKLERKATFESPAKVPKQEEAACQARLSLLEERPESLNSKQLETEVLMQDANLRVAKLQQEQADDQSQFKNAQSSSWWRRMLSGDIHGSERQEREHRIAWRRTEIAKYQSESILKSLDCEELEGPIDQAHLEISWEKALLEEYVTQRLLISFQALQQDEEEIRSGSRTRDPVETPSSQDF